MKTQESNCRAKWPKGLFVSDLDGTLLTDAKQIGSEDMATLVSLQQRGYLTAVATGRSDYSVGRLLKKLGSSRPESMLPFDFIIFSTGAGVMDFPGENLFRTSSLTAVEVQLIAKHLESSGIDYMIHRPIPYTRYFLFSSHREDNPDFQTRLRLYKDFATPLTVSCKKNVGQATEVLCILPCREGHARAAEIASALSRFSVIKATSPLDHTSIWVEIFAPAVSKAKAVQWLATANGIDRTNVCAVGNDYNDEDLLSWAGNSYIVSNGPAIMRSHFPTVASNNDGGVSEAVTRWLESSLSQNMYPNGRE